MNAPKLQITLNGIEQSMAQLAPYRQSALFNQFLVRGYSEITLDTVPPAKFSELLRAKVCLGTLITLYDDFADRPSQQNPHLLETLYQFDFQNRGGIRIVKKSETAVINFAHSLFDEIEDILEEQPNYRLFRQILNFDLKQFYSANQFSTLLMNHLFMNNSLENQLYTHHNMGMVMVAMMDLMAIEEVELSEVGAMREVFLMGQRMGRIFNVVTTHKREVLDGDITGELSSCKDEREIQMKRQILAMEISEISKRVIAYDSKIKTFSVKAYLEGLMRVKELHEKMEGII